jgi:hypothetical protein
MSIRTNIGDIVDKLCDDDNFEILTCDQATSAIIEIIRKGMPEKLSCECSQELHQTAIANYNKAITEFEKLLK